MQCFNKKKYLKIKKVLDITNKFYHIYNKLFITITFKKLFFIFNELSNIKFA